MKKERFKIIRLLAAVWTLLIGFSACQESALGDLPLYRAAEGLIELTKEEFISITFDEKKEISESGVLQIAKEYQGLFLANTKTRVTVDTPCLSIRNKCYVGDAACHPNTRGEAVDGIQVPVYEVNIQQGDKLGMAVVSGHHYFPIVLAYIPQIGNSIDSERSGASLLIQLAKQSLLKDVKRYRHICDSLRDRTVIKIYSQLQLDPNDFNQSTIEQYTCVKGTNGALTRSHAVVMPPQAMSGVFPFVKTEWHQGSPFNVKLEKGNVDGDYSYVPAGCAVIALAQLAAFAEIPLNLPEVGNVNWKYLKEYPRIFTSDDADKVNMVSSLIKHIYLETNTTPVVENGFVTGSSTTINAAANYIYSRFFHGDKQSYNPIVIKNSLNGFLPVLLMGGYHAFILDGYLMAKKQSRNIPANYDMYWHANMGWGGMDDGYYKLDPDESVDFETWGASTYHSDELSIVPYVAKK